MAALAVIAVVVRACVPGERRRRRLVQSFVTGMSQRLLRVLGVRCTFTAPPGQTFTGTDRLLLLPNHISYLDVLVIHAVMPAVFVTSRDIGATPVLGHICRAAGCAFVERKHRGHLLADIDQLSALLNAGYNVVLFPEGSTSAGDHLMEFKRSLLECAMRSRCRVHPVCIRYDAVDGRPFSHENRDQVAWYGDMTFFPHLKRLAAARSIDVRLSVLDRVAVRQQSRLEIARHAKAAIARCFHARA